MAIKDIRNGGTITLSNGKRMRIQPHSQRVFLAYWQNGAVIEVLLYQDKQPDAVESDRIQLIIRDHRGSKRGWLMNVEDVLTVIHGLSLAAEKAVEMGIPVKEGL